MSKRVAKSVVSAVSADLFNEALASYAGADAKASRLTAKMDEEITKIRDKYSSDLDTLKATKDTNFEIVQTYCTENPEQFTTKKSLDTVHGVVGFRTGTPKLKLLAKTNWNKVLDNLKAYLPSYVRTTEEPAKDRLLIDRNTPEVADNLAKVGLCVAQDETFYIDLKKEELAEA